MKGKGLTYILLIVVGLIWYNVFFRVKSNLFGAEDAFVAQQNTVQSLASVKRDTFALNARYRDPFNGRVTSEITVAADEPTTERYIPPPPPPEIWPQIIYYGQIKKTGSKTPLAILKIDGMQFYLRNGENVLDDYIIGKIYKDSVLVLHGKKKKMVRIVKQ